MTSRREFLVAGTAAALALALPGRLAAGETKRIFLVTWRGFEEGCKGFVDYLDKRGVKYELIHRDAARDKTRIPEFVAEIKKSRPDLVVTWGTSISVGVLGPWDAADPERHVTDIPAVFMFPANPLRARLVPDYEGSRRNVTGVRYVLSESQQLVAASKVLDFRVVGTVFHRDEINVMNALTAYERAAQRRGLGFVAEEIVDTEGGEGTRKAIRDAVTRLKGAGVEMLFLPPSSLIIQMVDSFTEAATRAGLPVFSAGQVAVRKSNALLGVGVPYFQTGRRAAMLAESILVEGRDPKDLPISPPRDFGYVVNLRVAESLGIDIPREILSVADVVR